MSLSRAFGWFVVVSSLVLLAAMIFQSMYLSRMYELASSCG